MGETPEDWQLFDGFSTAERVPARVRGPKAGPGGWCRAAKYRANASDPETAVQADGDARRRVRVRVPPRVPLAALARVPRRRSAVIRPDCGAPLTRAFGTTARVPVRLRPGPSS